MPLKRKKKPAKKAAKKRSSAQGAGLKKYRLAVKRATRVLDARIKKNESAIKKLKALKAKKTKAVKRKLAK